MKNSTKAVLLSALVFPGAGHFFLKKIVFGVALVGIALVALSILASHAVNKALHIVDKIQSGEVQLDITVVTELISQQPMGAEAQAINIATVILITVWLVGVIDSYRTGRMQENG